MRKLVSDQQILDAIQQFQDQHGFSPSYRELGVILGYFSTNTVHTRIMELESKGATKIGSPGSPRAIAIVNAECEYCKSDKPSKIPEARFCPMCGKRIGA